MRLAWTGAAPTDVLKPKLYVLAIGVSRYDDPRLTLAYAAKDAKDFVQALALRNRDWPATAVDGWLRIGRIRDDARNPQRDDGRALLAFQRALDLAQPRDKPAVIADVPAAYRDRLQRR